MENKLSTRKMYLMNPKEQQHMVENDKIKDQNDDIENLSNGKLYLICATLNGDDENGKRVSFDIHSYIIAPSSMNEKQVEETFKKEIHLDKDDKISFRMVKTGEVFQFLGYNDEHQLEEGLKEGDVFTFKRCGLDYIETFEKAPANEGVGWLFRPSEIGMFPPPENPFLNSPVKEEDKKEESNGQ